MDKEHLEKTRVNNKWPIAREGIPFILLDLIITAILLYFKVVIPGAIFVLLSLFTIYFFRDPDRKKETQENEIISPADGKILSILNLDDDQNLLGDLYVRF